MDNENFKKDIEYSKMAHLYDKFYSKKDYQKEAEFISSFIKKKNIKILDCGCGTGNHAKILFDLGYNVYGFDKSTEMIDIANKKLNNDHFFVDNLLDLKHNGKYQLIISFFAVFNHLKNYNEFKKALSNIKNLLKDNGTIIIDLHNPIKSGKKQETFDNIIRIMEWKKCKFLNKEFTKIDYIIDDKKYSTTHTFKIFNIKKLHKIAKKMNFKNIQFYENYNTNTTATKNSKNIQMVLSI